LSFLKIYVEKRAYGPECPSISGYVRAELKSNRPLLPSGWKSVDDSWLQFLRNKCRFLLPKPWKGLEIS